MGNENNDQDNAEIENNDSTIQDSAEVITSQEGSNAGDVLDSITDDMPQPQDHVIDAHNEKQAEIEQKQDVTDSAGEKFNPAIHAANEDGSPKYTKTKKFAKKRGRKTNSESASTIGTAPQATPQQIKSRAAGKAAAGALITLGIVIGGEEWQPQVNPELGLNEGEMLQTAFAEYFEATGRDDLPPGWALTIAIGAYAAPRFTMPKTQSRFGKMFGGIKKWWVNRKLKKHGLKAEKDEG
jgi:hypothetical protein